MRQVVHTTSQLGRSKDAALCSSPCGWIMLCRRSSWPMTEVHAMSTAVAASGPRSATAMQCSCTVHRAAMFRSPRHSAMTHVGQRGSRGREALPADVQCHDRGQCVRRHLVSRCSWWASGTRWNSSTVVRFYVRSGTLRLLGITALQLGLDYGYLGCQLGVSSSCSIFRANCRANFRAGCRAQPAHMPLASKPTAIPSRPSLQSSLQCSP
jgi:hypothetical protein